MATVYRATDVRHRRDVAVKVLHPDVAANAALRSITRELSLSEIATMTVERADRISKSCREGGGECERARREPD